MIRSGSQEKFFCCVAGVGMDAEANARANRMPPWLKSRGGYVLAALQSLIAFKPAEMNISAEGREIRRSAFFIAVGNALSYGGGMKVTPQATLDDGLLDICLVSKMNKLKLLCWVPTIFFGKHLRLKEVEYFQASQIGIEAERKLDLYADGEYAAQTPVEIGLIRRGLRVIVPPASSRTLKFKRFSGVQIDPGGQDRLKSVYLAVSKTVLDAETYFRWNKSHDQSRFD